MAWGVFFRYSYYQNQPVTTTYSSGQSHKPYVVSETRSEYHATPGFKLLTGWRIVAMQLGKISLIVDPYLGTGGRFIHTRVISQVSSHTTDKGEWIGYPTMHTGIKAGISW